MANSTYRWLQTTTLASALALAGCMKSDIEERYAAAEARCAPVEQLSISDKYKRDLFREFLTRNDLVLESNEYDPEFNFKDAIDDERLRYRSSGRRLALSEVDEMVKQLCPRQEGVLKK